MTTARHTAMTTMAFERLRSAYENAVPTGPVRDLVADRSTAGAYAIQQKIIAERIARGARMVGHKVGLTSLAVQRQLGVDQPDFGVLLDDMRREPDTPIDLSGLIAPRIEAEIAFVMREGLEDGVIDHSRVRGAVDHAVAALEIVDSRIENWDITFFDTVADNASSGLFVLGTQPRGLADFEPMATQMMMEVDGRPASTGTGADCLGDPLEALRWLATTLRDHGQPLRSGDVVLSGALGPMVAVTEGTTITASITGLGSVTAQFDSNDARQRGSVS
ncbi:2-keto-4-pentenoate hydratase [Gordonia aichiensis]|uniref:Putative 2-hydroxypenta-2,4-dienoate hydratase n=1 Tax=Gordonia aichiensis NBRC 108223 TaxID=1220583 RepID=L7KQF7_9ACTN|nr:fumarylacetoacetate hydrolase family protein [Gordonia aichiensis]GAC51075.1 putative 2-hydroxypenta-2,4-dienoate hydratase [Gordonia aichiensis NBRC 108223]